MALDLYVGGFSRFFGREWENVVQKLARESGTEYRMIGPGGPPQAADWNEVSEAVTHWRAAINQALGDNLATPLDWDESKTAPYFTDRPGYDAYGALLLWAAYAAHGKIPPESYDGEWYSDETYMECSQPTPDLQYLPILCGQLWLPGEFEFSFDFQDLTGDKVHICANRSLLQALDELNHNTLQLGHAALADARRGNPDGEPTLKEHAAFGLALFRDLAEKSVQHRLPIRLSM